MTISIMTPTRGRPAQMRQMTLSARMTALRPERLEVIFFIDEDDLQSLETASDIGAKAVVGPRDVIHSARWDKCLPAASGTLLFHANDDILFRTQGWDSMIEREFEQCGDKILMVHGDDLGCQRDKFGCHPCVHRKWVETLGYFIPPYFDGEYGDAVVNFIANHIGRRKFLPFVTEHMHHIFGKAKIDQTTRDYLARQAKQNPGKIYRERTAEWVANAAKLQKVIDDFSSHANT